MTGARVVVYGLTTEGYAIGSRMAINKAEVSIVDETTAAAIPLTADTAKAYPNVSMLKEDEPVLSMEPQDVAIPKAEYLVFAPMLRKSGPETGGEINKKFRYAVSPLRKGSSVVYSLPTGFHGNNENITVLEHMTGLEVGEDVSYYYYPMSSAWNPNVIGAFASKRDGVLLDLLSSGEDKTIVSLTAAEYVHANYILKRFTALCSVNEICKLATEKQTRADMERCGFGELFLDDMTEMRYDLHALGDSFRDTAVISYLISSGKKGMETYVRRLVNEVRAMLRERDMIASRCKLVILWTMDMHEMRGERYATLREIETMLRLHIGEVLTYSREDPDGFYAGNPDIVLACTRSDFERALQNKADRRVILIKASSLIETA